MMDRGGWRCAREELGELYAKTTLITTMLTMSVVLLSSRMVSQAHGSALICKQIVTAWSL